jgi:zinc metalloprotease ZmpB
MRIRITIAAALLALVLAAAAGATKPGAGSEAAARVFWINPVQSLQNEDLTDQKDARSAVPLAAYKDVTLQFLDGSGYLSGRYVTIRNEVGSPAYSPANGGTFNYFRDQDEFEQVMAYYWITQAQLYLQSLGFTGDRAILENGIDVRINQWGQDNSYFWDKHHVLRFGKGGVDDAEDAEVILHEYGHAIQGDQQPGFGPGLQSGSIGEGFGDYFAVSFGNAFTGNTFQPACVMDWDATFYTSTVPHCLRTTDRPETWPRPPDEQGEVHRWGRLWSRALWDINQALGNVRADRIIIGAQFTDAFGVDPLFADASNATVCYAAATDAPAVPAVLKAFVDRGFITEMPDCD